MCSTLYTGGMCGKPGGWPGHSDLACVDYGCRGGLRLGWAEWTGPGGLPAPGRLCKSSAGAWPGPAGGSFSSKQGAKQGAKRAPSQTGRSAQFPESLSCRARPPPAGDQANARLLAQVVADTASTGRYDVIIDDGGHNPTAQLLSLQVGFGFGGQKRRALLTLRGEGCRCDAELLVKVGKALSTS